MTKFFGAFLCMKIFKMVLAVPEWAIQFSASTISGLPSQVTNRWIASISLKPHRWVREKPAAHCRYGRVLVASQLKPPSLVSQRV